MLRIENKIDQLKNEVLEMLYLVKSQLEKGQQALLEFNEDLAHEIIAKERRVNALELRIDGDCENILALYNPVANDLRFILAAYKINSDIERLGDHANSVASYILEFGEPMEKEAIEKMRLREMYATAIKMMNNVLDAFDREDTTLARKVFKLDMVLNEINSEASTVTAELARQNPDKISLYLYLFSIIRKMERVGDLTKNIAEEITFYIEAKVLKHKKDKYKSDFDNDNQSKAENI
ncbi:MAG TPA: phosphate signaling complex protein PhoU [Balneolaceae bacterium]|nr:phosphate signaling complex protein PhoU [Balneolaceae bacterium]